MNTQPNSARIKLPVKDPRVEDLLLWRDPKKSGIALAGVSAVFGVIQYATMNIIANGAYLLAALIVGCFLYNNIASFTNRPPLPLPRFLKEGVSESDVRTYADRATTFINKGLGYAYRLANGREPALTGAAAGALYFVARLASTFSLLGLAYMAVLAAFSVPKVYELKKDEIDAAIDKIRSQATSAYDKYGAVVVNRIPRAATAKPAESSSQAKKEE